MEDSYKIFQKGYNKVLDLVEEVDAKLAQKYKDFVDSLPNEVVDKIGECKDFCESNKENSVDICALVNAVDVDYTKYKNYLRTNLCVHRIFEDNLFVNDFSIRLFGFSERNTERKMPDLQMYFEEINGEYHYLGNNDQSNGKSIEIEWDVYLDRIGEDFVLSSTKYFKGCEVYKKVKVVSFDEVMQCVEDEDGFEDDMEFEFKPDFDL